MTIDENIVDILIFFDVIFLLFVFEYVKNLLMVEYENVRAVHDNQEIKIKKNKPRKKTVTYTKEYFQGLSSTEKISME